MSATLDPKDRAKLRNFLEQRFNLTELKGLAFDLGIAYDSLPHNTATEFSTELIGWCERRDILRSLITEVLRQRKDDYLAQLLSKLPVGSSIVKVQIIIAEDVVENWSEIRADLAAKLKIDVNEICLIGVANGSVHLLISLPQEAAEALVRVKDSSDSRQDLQRALEIGRRVLAKLEEQAAGYTSLTIPAHLDLQLEDKRKEVARLEAALKAASQSAGDAWPEQLQPEFHDLVNGKYHVISIDLFNSLDTARQAAWRRQVVNPSICNRLIAWLLRRFPYLARRIGWLQHRPCLSISAVALAFLALIVFILRLFSSAPEPAIDLNTPVSFTVVSADRIMQVWPGDTVTLPPGSQVSVTANIEAGQQFASALQFQYFAPTGSISFESAGPKAFYTAPGGPGVDIVTVQVTAEASQDTVLRTIRIVIK